MKSSGIHPAYINWLKKKLPDSQINLLYLNMVGTTMMPNPLDIPSGIRLWTYDDFDAEKYGMNLIHDGYSCKKNLPQKKEPEYDILFIGQDKGRGKYLLDLEKQFNNMGLSTKFIITAVGKRTIDQSIYQQAISYNEVLDYVTRSRCVLNVTMENQRGVTMRDFESMFFNIKLITTNKDIKNKDFYIKDNVFILEEDNMENLVDFVYGKPKPVSDDILDRYTYSAFLNKLIYSPMNQ